MLVSLSNKMKLILSSHSMNLGPNHFKYLPIVSKKEFEAVINFSKKKKLQEKTIKSVPTLKSLKEEAPSFAAVLVPICSVGGKPSIIFTLRSGKVGSHKNQISFPGGHFDTRLDKTIEDTARREMEEELRGSIDYQKDIEILGRTDDVPSLSGTIVTPVVAVLHRIFLDTNHFHRVFWNPCKDEVEKVFFRTVQDLLDSETNEVLKRLGGRKAPCFPGDDGNIWGLTALILKPIIHKVLIPALHGVNDLKI